MSVPNHSIEKICLRCGELFPARHPKTERCAVCRPINKAKKAHENYVQQKALYAGRNRSRRKAERELRVSPPAPAVVTISVRAQKITDAEQAKIDRHWDEPRIYPVKVFTAEEIEAVKNKLVPIGRIRSCTLQDAYSRGITAPAVGNRRERYPESSGSISI